MAKAVLDGHERAAGTAASSISARSTARPGNMARSIMPPPNRASTASPRRWRRKARAPASPSTRSRPAISTPTWSRRCPPDVLGKIVAKIPVGRLGKAEEIARGVAFLCRRGWRLRHRLDAVDQRRPAYVLMPATSVTAARQTIGADRRPRDVDQPGADLLARARGRGARRGLPVNALVAQIDAARLESRPTAQPDLGDPPVAIRARAQRLIRRRRKRAAHRAHRSRNSAGSISSSSMIMQARRHCRRRCRRGHRSRGRSRGERGLASSSAPVGRLAASDRSRQDCGCTRKSPGLGALADAVAELAVEQDQRLFAGVAMSVSHGCTIMRQPRT